MHSPAPLDAALVQRLVDTQFPQWSSLGIRQVVPGGWDNRTFRLGDDLLVRLPSADGYAAAVAKEQQWLPVIAAHVGLQIPEPVGRGAPTAEFPRPWSVYRWIDGESSANAPIEDLTAFALDVAGFLSELVRCDAAGGPAAGDHSFHRGAHPRFYDAEVQRSLERLEDVIDTTAARRVWDAALRTRITAPPVWFHGDIAPGNLLVRGGRLAAVIDFGTSGVGDPACDLAIAWTMFDEPARVAFRDALGWSEDVWARGRAWALWKAMLLAAGDAGAHDPAAEARSARDVIARILADAP
ncbi:aminoglycoside phosphotransferase family protein [uncultured Microbacterium sp.]|uniref:aminoglycoside phosphotransferase family protein n=1 Tax=uncultured Microbacterium sp. TaxID=191216 RepID=UPI0028D61EF5|nr:aminoglycoside phosphotransferase family protein [uncultured Microbacterium sp.]